MIENSELSAEQHEMDAIEHFMTLKTNYDNARSFWVSKWDSALAAFNMDKENLLNISSYESDSKFVSPKMLTKLKAVVARKMRILFNVEPIGRIEDAKVRKAKPKSLIDLINRYIFGYQLEKIKFKQMWRQMEFLQGIYGVAIAYLPHEYEMKKMTFADGKSLEINVKNDTYFKPIITGDFYTDATKLDLRDSEANIYTRIVKFQDLKALEKKTETFIEPIEQPDGSVIEQEYEEEIGIYHNLDLIQSFGKDITEYQEMYIKKYYYSNAMTSSNFKDYSEFKNYVKDKTSEVDKTGNVQVDTCFGKFWFFENGEWVYDEAICEIANGYVVIRLDRTPFQHTKYTRPFIALHENPLEGSFYCHSNITAALDLYMELNSNRQMATDAKKRTVFPMKYIDTSKSVNWDGKWRKDGIVKGVGQAPFQDLVNPYLGTVTNADNILFNDDIDTVFNISTVQEGIARGQQVPNTARGTAALIAQNDVPLNDKINFEIEEGLKPFIEILFERNLQFKTLKDLLDVWDDKDILKLLIELGFEQPESEEEFNFILDNFDLTQLFFEPKIKIMGNMELSNEVAQQAGYTQFLNFASAIPPIAKRLDWKEVAQKMLRSYGIKDDADLIFLDEESVAKTDEIRSQSEQQAIQKEKEDAMISRQLNVQQFEAEEGIKTRNKITEMHSEAMIEKQTGQKIM